jgi:hypothetical protein
VPHLPYGPPNVRLIRPKRLPQALRDAGVALVEQKLSNSTVKDLVSISDDEWQIACRAPRMLLIDEIQHLLSCGLRDQRAALNAIKFLANKLRISIVAAGTHEALHVMRADPQIASRFEQLELPVWTESQELRRFIAGYLALLPIKRSPAAIDKRFVEYLLELSEGVTGRIIEVLRRAALQGIADKTQKVTLVQLPSVAILDLYFGRS